MKKYLFLLITLACYSNSFACINMYKTLASGEVVYDEFDGGIIRPQFSDIEPSDFDSISNVYYLKYKETGDVRDLSDYASLLAFQGKLNESKELFIEIEKSSPNLYSSATNLGTVYELLGQIDSAYYWIEKGIKINPTSHHSSEWIHLRVLEYLKDSSRLVNNSIIGLNFGTDSLSIPPAGFDLEELEKMLYHQLHERLFFINEPNEIVAYLYFDYANTISHTMSLEDALEAYKEAERFGLDIPLLKVRVSKIEEMTQPANEENNQDNEPKLIDRGSNFWYYIIGGLFIVFLIFWVVRIK